MSGKFCTGAATNNAGAANIRDMVAFKEGLEYRAGGTAAARPLTGNPHDGDGSTAETSWDLGWAVADDASPSAIDPADAPCVAVPAGNISA